MAFHQCVSRSVVLVTKGHNPTEILVAQSHLVLIDSVGRESVRQKEDWNIWGPLSLGGCFTHTSPGMNQRLTSAGLYTSCLHVASATLGFSQGVGWVLENEPSKGINTSVITLLVGAVMALARFKGKGQSLLLSKGGVSENLEPCFIPTTNTLLDLRF